MREIWPYTYNSVAGEQIQKPKDKSGAFRYMVSLYKQDQRYQSLYETCEISVVDHRLRKKTKFQYSFPKWWTSLMLWWIYSRSLFKDVTEIRGLDLFERRLLSITFFPFCIGQLVSLGNKYSISGTRSTILVLQNRRLNAVARMIALMVSMILRT